MPTGRIGRKAAIIRLSSERKLGELLLSDHIQTFSKVVNKTTSRVFCPKLFKTGCSNNGHACCECIVHRAEFTAVGVQKTSNIISE